MPIWNWFEILKTGDLKHLFMNSGFYTKKESELKELNLIEETKKNKEELNKSKSKIRVFVKKAYDIWDDLQDEYIDIFGLDDNFKKKLKLLKEKAMLNYEFIITGDRFINTLLAIVDADLDELGESQGITFYELKSHLEKFKGHPINPKETTVIEWNYDLKIMSNGK